MSLLLGLDIGTSSCKAVLIDERARVVAVASAEVPLEIPRPGWTQQDPADWWNAAVGATRRVGEIAREAGRGAAGPPEISAIGLTGQMHGLTLLDSHGDVLRPAILWNDQRTAAECDEITRRVGAERVLALTGNPVLTGFTAPKLLWVKRHEPDGYARIAHILLPKDYIRFRLSGACASDVADASGTSLFDVGRRQWSDEMCAAVDVPRAWLPEVAESPVVTAHVSAAAAAETGLRAGTPIVAGAGDQAAGAVGAGIVREGIVGVTIGTSGVVFAASQRYQPEPRGRLHAFCHAVPGMWHWMGVMLAAGGSFEWLSETLGVSHETLLSEAAAVAPGSDGLLFLPYLSGERTPHGDPHARGVFFGLSLAHGRGHLARAVLEGVAFGLRDALELLHGMGLKTHDFRVSGGGARSALWRQIVADVFNEPVAAVEVPEGAAFGAALLAGVGAGVFGDVSAAAAAAGPRAEQDAPSVATGRYAELYLRYRALYPALREQFSTGSA